MMAADTSIFTGFLAAHGAFPRTSYEAFEAAYKAALSKYKSSPEGAMHQRRFDKKVAEIEESLRNRQ